MAEIALEGVRKVYSGNVTAIHELSLAIADGALCVLVGPSGCGKSTLLRMVAGLERTTAGGIRIGGRAVENLEPAERDIAMVFQNYALYPHMSVYDNMAYGLRNQGTPKAEIRTRVDEAAGILGLSDFLGRKPRQLSGGQRQRVAMGRAIVRKPQVFLFDEPLSNLDAKLRVRTRVEIRDLQRRLATTAIYVTHDQSEAMTLADQLVVMNAGRIEQVGAPLDVYDRPASAFVAEFIGSPPMNLLPGEADEAGVHVAGRRVAPPGPVRGPVTVGIRPEHLVPSDDGALPVTVRLAEPLGATVNLYGRLDGAGAELVVSLAGGAVPAPGARLGFAPGGHPVHLFDPETGRRLA